MSEIKRGEMIVESPATGNKYKVTKWKERDGNMIEALEKERIDS